MTRRHALLVVLLPLVAACTTATPRSGGAPGAPGAPSASASSPSGEEMGRWRARAAGVTIARDEWGIAHVRARTDADAVFGMMYAQAEDDFNRVETNFLTSLGRTAEAEGERAVWQDLRQRLFVDPDSLRAMYGRSPTWLRALMDGWADGLNFYLATHPEVRPRVLRRFEPWMALSFSEGSIGGDIESISTVGLESFYRRYEIGGAGVSVGGVGGAAREERDDEGDPLFREPRGSNGIAIAPRNTTAGNALLLINPHTSFFFRSELQATSDEGLNVYGAATWGQFFIYQGFNDRLGWMHTSSGVDVIDEFAEAVTERGGARVYRYGGEERPVAVDTIAIAQRTASGGVATRRFVVFRTHHGPIVREADGRWIAVALMNRPVEALSQSYLRTKARDFASYRKVLETYRANSSNNTIYADADGHIAYFHPQFIPRRDDRFDYTRPVDGSDPATDWRGVHATEEAPFLLDPPTGWIQNTNNWPYSAAGPVHSPARDRFPKYMDVAGENARGVHAMMLLDGRRDFTLEGLRAAAYDSYLPAMAEMVPALVRAWDEAPASDTLKARLAEQVSMLRGWDYRWGVASVPTTLAVHWAEEMLGRARAVGRRDVAIFEWVAARSEPRERLEALAAASDKVARDFGTWRTPWGEVNRFQRLTGDIVHPFTDAGPSIPVGFTSAQWGSLASFGARAYPGTKRRYGTSGNSFVAVVEFGRDGPRARAVSAGGESGDPKSPHFRDQAERYATGDLREVHFTPASLEGHVERRYRPGER